MGYAPLALTRDDQSAEPCPYLGADLGEGPTTGNLAVGEDDRGGSPALHEGGPGQSRALGAALASRSDSDAGGQGRGRQARLLLPLLLCFGAHAAVGCWGVRRSRWPSCI